MFVIVSILWLIGVLLLRKNKELLGYVLIVAGWILSIVAEVIFSSAWDRGFGSFFVGLVFIWFVQMKMKASTNTSKK